MSRLYSITTPEFWTGATGRLLRDYPATVRELAFLLHTGPNATMYGLYYKTIRSMAEETGRTMQSAQTGLDVLNLLGYARYDATFEHVWVVHMAELQVAPLPLKTGDCRVRAVNRWYQTAPRTIFLGPFYDHYADLLRLEPPRRDCEGAADVTAAQEGACVQPLTSGSGSGSRSEEQGIENSAPTPEEPSLFALTTTDGRVRTSAGQRFEAFWRAWPPYRRIAKKMARAAWDHINPDDALTAHIIGTLERQKQNPKWHQEGGAFIPHPHRWLRQARWEDGATVLPALSASTVQAVTAAQQFLTRDRTADLFAERKGLTNGSPISRSHTET